MHAHAHSGWYSDYHNTGHEILPPHCQHMNHGSMTLFSARGQNLSTPSPMFSSIPSPNQPPPPPPLSSCLINSHAALLETDREPGEGTKLLSRSQQQLMQELQQQIGFSNKLLSSLRLLPRLFMLCHPQICPTMVEFFLQGTDIPKQILYAPVCVCITIYI